MTPTVRLGVTGLARAGKTVFITALVRNLIAGGRLPLFSPWLRAASRAPIWSRSPTIAFPASPTRSISPSLQAIRRDGPKARAASASCGSRSSIVSAKTAAPGAHARPAACRYRRLSRRMAARSAAARSRFPRVVEPVPCRCAATATRAGCQSRGSNFSPRSMPTAPPTSKSRSTALACSPAICRKRAPPIPRLRLPAPDASCCPATPRDRRC